MWAGADHYLAARAAPRVVDSRTCSQLHGSPRVVTVVCPVNCTLQG